MENQHESVISQPWGIIQEPELAPLLGAYRIEQIYKNYNPSYIFNQLNIAIPKNIDSWDDINYRNRHYLNMSLIKLADDTEGINIQPEDILEILKGSNSFLPRITALHYSDWPYLLFAQLQLFGEMYKLKPSEILCLFAISFPVSVRDTWDIFNWKNLLREESVILKFNQTFNIIEN